ncbi:B12-binding domain-containing radical SAM protein [Embleya sp. NPDC055664]
MSVRAPDVGSIKTERLMRVAALAAPGDSELAAAFAVTATRHLTDPTRLRAHIEEHLAGRVGRVVVGGSLDRRLVLVERTDQRWVAADLSGNDHRSREWPAWVHGNLHIENPSSWLSLAAVNQHAIHRLARPRVLLVALYHPEHFPLPRFPLGISDLARAARRSLLGDVRLMDMQLGATLDGIVAEIREGRPDILGISATFGQHDLMIRLLDTVSTLPDPPRVIAGGSLTARNEALLLDRYPDLLIGRGAGESTIADLIAHWHDDLTLDRVRGIGYVGASRGNGTMIIGRQGPHRHTPASPNRLRDDFLPELDLLDATLRSHGVVQLEASRGCTNFCSFCPRAHKGQWAGGEPADLPWMLDEIDTVFRRHPSVSRTLYLVDEEFIGRGADAVPRALATASVLHDADFAWETSCRVDQVVHPGREVGWHAERAAMWRTLVQRGLRRCLFGVESGVDSILTRFNKETTGEQNALAIRTLSALGVPTRYTYITFDHLMTLAELEATHAFQGRTDLLLRPQPHLTPEQIVDAVRDRAFVDANSTGRPFHSGISYMLVSMECLIGAAYTHQVAKAGLAGAVRPSMGRRDAEFADWRIGLCSTWAQLWIDRNFAFDYTLKSLEKVLDGDPRRAVRRARSVIKNSAYTVLGGMLDAARETGQTRTPAARDLLDDRLRRLVDAELSLLQRRMAVAAPQVGADLAEIHATVLEAEHRRWRSARGWELINASDPCGT